MKSITHQISTNTIQNYKSYSMNPLTSVRKTQQGEIVGQSQTSIIKVSKYQWTDQQNRKYYHFLINLKQTDLAANPQAKIKKINVQMSNHVRSRSATQCRSHNQKMLNRFGSIENIIGHFKCYFERKDGKQLGFKSLQTIQPNIERENTLQFQPKTTEKPWPLTFWDLQYSLNQHPTHTQHQIKI